MNDKPYASDEECLEMRNQLIGAGKIVPKQPDSGEAGRESAESADVGTPHSRRRINVNDIPEEGTYEVRPITSDAEYERRKRNYFIMLQSVLRAREELKLEFDDQPPKRKRRRSKGESE